MHQLCIKRLDEFLCCGERGKRLNEEYLQKPKKDAIYRKTASPENVYKLLFSTLDTNGYSQTLKT